GGLSGSPFEAVAGPGGAGAGDAPGALALEDVVDVHPVDLGRDAVARRPGDGPVHVEVDEELQEAGDGGVVQPLEGLVQQDQAERAVEFAAERVVEGGAGGEQGDVGDQAGLAGGELADAAV